MKTVSIVTMAVALAGAGAAVGQQANILDRAINTPGIAYSFYGDGQTAKVVRDAAVAGGQAYRVTIARKGATAYEIGASAPIGKAINKGDTVVMAVWLRAPKLAAGETTPVPFLGVVGPAPAYAPIASGSADVTPEWKLFNARGVAAVDVPAGQAGVTLHLAAAKAVLDLGPVFVLDLGKTGAER